MQKKMLLIATFGLICSAAHASERIEAPSSQKILQLSAQTSFESTAITDDPVPAEIKTRNPNFVIRVFFRNDKKSYTPEQGVVVARVELKAIPDEYNLPDGTYYLWMGGPAEAPRAFLSKTDGSILVEVQVRNEPSLPEEAKPHLPRIHAGIERAGLPLPGTPPLPPGGTHPRSWREICYPYAPTDHGPPGGWRWIRVPDN